VIERSPPEFLPTSLIVILLPGTGGIQTPAFGLGRGGRASGLAGRGFTFDIVPHIAAKIVGLAAVLHAGAVVPDRGAVADRTAVIS
jgi:threonine/homoserine/homoserine lactone efflux protein